MTDDELLYSANELIANLEEHRIALEQRHKGKIVRAYGEKLMRVDTVWLDVSANGGLYFRGAILNKDGSPNKATNAYSVDLESAEFVKP